MNHKRNHLTMAIRAIFLTFILYLIDSDEPYADFSATMIEFSIIVFVLFVFFAAIYWVIRFIANSLKQVSK